MCKPANGSKADDGAGIPFLATLWLRAYDAVPEWSLPGTQVRASFALASAFFLASVRFGAEAVLPPVFGWPAGTTAIMEGAANCASIVHSSLLCPGLAVALYTQPYCPNEKLSVAPRWWRKLVDALIQFCTGYMVYDATVNILYLRWNKGDMLPTLGDDDVLFLGHHIITSSYMTSTRLLQAGHISAMMCMFIGELTNPLHNAYMMSEVAITLDCCNGPVGQFLNRWITIVFAAFYFTVRAMAIPLIGVHMTYNLLGTSKGRTNIPLWINVLWNVMIWIVVFGSMSWIQKCYDILLAFASTNAAMDMQDLVQDTVQDAAQETEL